MCAAFGIGTLCRGVSRPARSRGGVLRPEPGRGGVLRFAPARDGVLLPARSRGGLRRHATTCRGLRQHATAQVAARRRQCRNRKGQRLARHAAQCLPEQTFERGVVGDGKFG